MRRSRRGKSSALEFGGSGEDSFVAVVVTKLTGALLFILLLTMVIMALLPKAVDFDVSSRDIGSVRCAERSRAAADRHTRRPTRCRGGPSLSRRPRGHRGQRHSALVGCQSLARVAHPGGIDRPALRNSPKTDRRTIGLADLRGDGTDVVGQSIQLAVLSPQSVATAGSWWKPRWHAVAWRAWLEQGFGFLVLWLVHLLGMNLLGSLERQSLEETVVVDGLESGQIAVQRRFSSYRILIRLASLSATIALAAWLVLSRGHSM